MKEISLFLSQAWVNSMDKKYEVAIRTSTRILHCLRSPTSSSVDSGQLRPVSRAPKRSRCMHTQQLQYTGILYFGTPPSRFTVVFDTEIPWTWLNKVGCETCRRFENYFDPSQSTTCQRSGNFHDVINTVNLGNPQLLVSGEIVNDTVSFDISQTVSIRNQSFLLVDESKLGYQLLADGYAVKRYTGTGTHSKRRPARLSGDQSEEAGSHSQGGVLDIRL